MAEKKRVLFVDDEPSILDGLRRTMRSMRHEWEMSFAGSGQEALELLASQAFDVIVTDMRMPGMDGAELLRRVMESHPKVARIVLSGQADKETIYRALGPMHQYLAKPCDSKTLKATLEGACTISSLLGDEVLKELVSKMVTLPSLPSLYSEMMDEIQAPEPSIKKVAEIVSKDIGMTAKMLQIVNSALFGLSHRVADPAQAVSLLGLDTVRSLVLSVHVFRQFDGIDLEGFSLEALWNHSMQVGSYAKSIARSEGEGGRASGADGAFIAGLLHDVGKLVLVANLPGRYGEALCLCEAEGLAIAEAEKRVFGTTHAEVGGYLMGLWGLPTPVIDAIAFHHRPAETPAKSLRLLAMVHVADAIAHSHPESLEASVPTLIDQAYLGELALAERLPEWIQACAALSESAGEPQPQQ